MQQTSSRPRLTPRRSALVAAALLAAVAAVPVFAQDPATPVPTTDPTVEATVSPEQLRALTRAAGGGAASSNGFAPFEQVISGLKEVNAPEGTRPLLKLYQPDGDDARDSSRLIAAIPPSLMGKDLLLATSISSGPLAGYQWNDYLVRFERRGRNVVLVVPDMSRVAKNPGSTVRESVERTYTPTILVSMPIESITPSGELAVDMSPLTVGGAIPVPGGSGVRRDLSRYTKVKVFPENVLIDTELAFGGRGSGAETVGVSYAFRELPSLSGRDRYTPRLADERVGYFLTVKQDWSSAYDDRDLNDRYINRWRVEKLDPDLEMSPPKEPIVFYIEKTVPIQWRRYVQEGIEEWNKAFEKVGVIGAIQVRQQTDSDYADIDPEDARYNFIRWIVTGRGFAMGPSRVDPRTGQILDADIIFDDSMLRYFQEELDLLGPKAMIRDLGPDMLSFWQEHPQFRPMGIEAQDITTTLREHNHLADLHSHEGSNFAVNGDPNAGMEAQQKLREILGMSGQPSVRASRLAQPAHCDYASGIRQQLSIAHWTLMAGPTTAPSTQPATEPSEEAEQEAEKEAKPRGRVKLPERYLGLVLKEVVAHEVGHTIGLRHNFKASQWLSLEEIRERRNDPTQPLVSSVMDYNPVVLFTGDDPKEVPTFITPVIGPYDMWAVEYGYTIASPQAEKKVTAEIAGKAGRKELAYATDEDASGIASPDPFVNTYDLGDDPIAYSKSRAELVDALMADLQDWAMEDDVPNDELRKTFVSLFSEKMRNARYVARLVGGQSFSRVRFSDTVDGGDAPGLTPVPAEQQRAAIAYLDETLFNDKYFSIEAELWNKLVPSRQPTITSYAGPRIDFPIHQTILNAQNYALSLLCNPTILQRIYDAEIKSTEDNKFTAAEAIGSVKDAIWGEINASQSSIARNLQQQHLDYLCSIADSEPGQLCSADLRNIVRYELRNMSEALAKALENKAALDTATAAHFVESKSRIDRTLEAPLIKAGGGGGSIIIMMGQETK